MKHAQCFQSIINLYTTYKITNERNSPRNKLITKQERVQIYNMIDVLHPVQKHRNEETGSKTVCEMIHLSIRAAFSQVQISSDAQ